MEKYLDEVGLEELASIIKSLTGNSATQLTNEDLNNVRSAGLYYTTGQDSVTNKPVAECYNNVIRVTAVGNGSCRQEFYCMDSNRSYQRNYKNSTWTTWTALLNNTDFALITSSDIASMWGN